MVNLKKHPCCRAVSKQQARQVTDRLQCGFVSLCCVFWPQSRNSSGSNYMSLTDQFCHLLHFIWTWISYENKVVLVMCHSILHLYKTVCNTMGFTSSDLPGSSSKYSCTSKSSWWVYMGKNVHRFRQKHVLNSRSSVSGWTRNTNVWDKVLHNCTYSCV